MKIYTKTGDAGDTSLLGGVRVSKADPRVEAYGSVDEANAAIGVARAHGLPADIDAMFDKIQRDLFALGAELADARAPRPQEPTGAPASSKSGKAHLTDADVTQLEHWIDELDAGLPPLRRFILPGGSPAGAALHLARTIARRAERRMIALPDPGALQLVYINRLSDLLFVIARAVNHRAGVPESEW